MKLSFALLWLCVPVLAQQSLKDDYLIVNDSTWASDLENVVVSGQYNPQSVQKSIFEVRVINRATIEKLAANNLADVLNQSLNITIIPNASTGKSSVELFGLDGQYFKILMDNIPLVSDEGMGNNIDLTQINIDDIERIEIVEGSMGVEYGANAVSGIINIITKKSSAYDWEITPYIQEESIGNEYNFTDQGRHIQSLRVARNFNEKWFANAVYTRNNFNGFFNDRQGKNYDVNDGLRGYEWLPKLQHTTRTLLNYRGEKFSAFYKFEWFNEEVQRFGSTVLSNFNAATQTSNPTANDERFFSNRIYHHLHINGGFSNQVTYNLDFSYQQQKREIETFTYRIRQRQEFNNLRQEFESRNVLFSRGTFSNFTKKESWEFQLGYELQSLFGFASPMANPLGGDLIQRRLTNYDVFASAEFQLSKKLSIRPGARLMLTNQFDPLLASSFTAKYKLPKEYELRAIIGTSPRTPSYDELYTFFVDSNHDVRGNENLNPERGYSAFVHLKKQFKLPEKSWDVQARLSTWYLGVQDRIELVVVNPTPLAFQFNNIDRFRSWGIGTENTARFKQLSIGAGLSVTGVSKVLDSREAFNDDFLYGLQANLNFSYQIPKQNLVFSAFLKHNGPQFQFVQRQDENGDTVLQRGRLGAFTWMDATIRKGFLDNTLQVTIGARNLFDITQVNTTATEGGAHNAAATNLLLGYGRSFIFQLLYNFKM